ncbi:adenylate/guanylate cyclase domain-containing protein [Mycobacterium sp.]|uniref:adenylate/guanylate cyclase domain-containing protein n=1 Tax=Mycobacterium sp. TaxID=1785 RepID=UPI000CB322FA|nr:adenylate/guanylate cyclase domain-containing protein [Mycobacterium sp.]PJE06006.1 MAG: adenylate/guanylate cyclase domain-containing protein [Mycobacterium sp.]
MAAFDRGGPGEEFLASAADEREELVAWLLQEGFDQSQIDGAISPLLLPANRVFGDDGSMVSAQAVAETSGVPIDLIIRLHHAVGLSHSGDPHNVVHSRADAEAVLPAASLVQLGIDAEQVVLTVRLLVAGLTRAAVAMRYGGLNAILNPGVREVELAQDLERLAEKGKPIIDAMINEIASLTLRRSFETEAITLTERWHGALSKARTISVAFADVVGFTRLVEELALDELSHVVDVLVDATHDVAAEPVQFVKTIGDAVMLVSPDAAKLVSVVLELLDHAGRQNLQLRAGIATGTAMSRAGDWYGRPVNVASRITDIAPPGAVWVAESTRDAASQAAGIVFEHAASRMLRGVQGATNLFAATGIGPSSDG